MSQNTFTVDSGTTSVFLDLPLLESAAGITFVGADSTGEPASDEFQVGFPIVEDTDFTFETPPVVPVSGSFEHSGTITLGVGGADVTLGEFSIAFDETRVSDTASGFFVADTTDDALGLEVLFDVGITGDVAADSGSLTISDKDLLLAPELADALGDTALTGADVGEVQIDAAISSDVTTDIDTATSSDTDTAVSTSSDTDIFISPADEEVEVEPTTPETFSIASGTTSVFLDLPLLESAAGITLVSADSTGEPASEDFQVGFPIIEDTDFAFAIDPFAPVSGSIEHSGTITLGLGGDEVTVGDFSIGFDETRVSETASGFFVADTTEDALDLEILFDVGVPGSLTADSESLEITEADLLIAPEFAEALGAAELTGADIGDTLVDAATAADAEVINLLDAEDLTVDLSAVVNASNENVGGFYQAIDETGTVIDPVSGAEIAVGDEGYIDSAIANSVAEIGDGEATTLDLEGDFVYVPYLLADGAQFFSSFAEVNPEGFDNVQSLGENIFGFEDEIGGGDLDFDDFVLTAETV
ncbi:MAG: DUF4114 domain-containing protein [Cyanobacteria bacterium P01_G01_bin.39]